MPYGGNCGGTAISDLCIFPNVWIAVKTSVVTSYWTVSLMVTAFFSLCAMCVMFQEGSHLRNRLHRGLAERCAVTERGSSRQAESSCPRGTHFLSTV